MNGCSQTVLGHQQNNGQIQYIRLWEPYLEVCISLLKQKVCDG